MGQLGIRIINIVLFTTSCFFSAGVFNHIADHQLAPDYAPVMKPTARPASEEPSWQERSAILERNLFGAKLKGSEKPTKQAPPPPDPEEEAKETKLPIELLGTLAAEPVEFSTAVIKNTRAKGHQVVAVGDVLEGFDEVTVTSIEPRRVLLRNRSVIEELLLEKEDGQSKAAANPRTSRRGRGALNRLRDRKARRSAARRPNVVTPANEAANDEEDERMRQIQSAMAKNLIRDLQPAYDDAGKINGVKVGEIEPDGILSRAGLAADDVIESLNGIDINSAGAAARVMREMSKCKPMTGSVIGPGGPRSIEIGQDLLAELNCPTN